MLVSSFYGATGDASAAKDQLFRVHAEDQGQDNRLRQAYLGMRDKALTPVATRFNSAQYSFRVDLREIGNSKRKLNQPFDALRLVWHDYPGEWFEQEPSSKEESMRRVETFQSLMASDVAVLLVDGQKLIDHKGDEEKYLKSLFGNFSNTLANLRNAGALKGGKPRLNFPRIWIIALSKADLLDLDVTAFSDLVRLHATDELELLRDVISGFIEAPEALAIGGDYLLLSSAKFEPGRIELEKRIGLDLILPIASILPLERFARWETAKRLGGKAAEIAAGGSMIAVALLGKVKLPGPFGVAQQLLVGGGVLSAAASLAKKNLEDAHSKALARRDVLTATLTKFKMDLDQAETSKKIIRGQV